MKYVTYEYCPQCGNKINFTEVDDVPENYYYEDEPIDDTRFFCLGAEHLCEICE